MHVLHLMIACMSLKKNTPTVKGANLVLQPPSWSINIIFVLYVCLLVKFSCFLSAQFHLFKEKCYTHSGFYAFTRNFFGSFKIII